MDVLFIHNDMNDINDVQRDPTQLFYDSQRLPRPRSRQYTHPYFGHNWSLKRPEDWNQL